ncbi:MAG: hypothetical protein ACFFEL_09945 [Candidatus Thorarchaeota archaeon]
MSIIAESILSQFVRGLNMTSDAVEKVPNSKWNDGAEKWFFSLTAYHIVETLDFYSRNDHEGMIWGKRAGFSWEDKESIEKDILPKITKDLVLEYILETEEKLSDLLKNTSDQDLLEKDAFHWFSCILEKLQYALRHTAYHCGELALALRNWDSPHVSWK